MDLEIGDTHCQSLAQWSKATAIPSRDDVQASSPYKSLLAHQLQRIGKVDEILVLGQEICGTNRVIIATSIMEK